MGRKKSGIAVKIGDNVIVYTLRGDDSHANIRNELNRIDNARLISQHQCYVAFVPVRGLFYIEGYDFVFDETKPEWWTDAMTESAKDQLFRAAMDEWDGKTLKTSGSIDFRHLMSLEKGVTMESGGFIGLGSLTSLPEDVTLIARDIIFLKSLRSMSGHATIKAGGNINLSSLQSIAEDVTLSSGEFLFLRSLMNIDDGVKIDTRIDIYLSTLPTIGERVIINVGGYINVLGQHFRSIQKLEKAMGQSCRGPKSPLLYAVVSFGIVAFGYLLHNICT